MTDIGDGIFKFDLKTVGQTDNGKVSIVINNGIGNGRQTKNLTAKSGTLFTPSEEPVDTKQDEEAFKYFYSCTSSAYTEKQPEPEPKPEPEPQKTIGKLGDADGDGNITSADALSVLRASVGLENYTANQMKLADVDADNNLTSGDSLYILRASVGIKSEYPIGENVA